MLYVRHCFTTQDQKGKGSDEDSGILTQYCRGSVFHEVNTEG